MIKNKFNILLIPTQYTVLEVLAKVMWQEKEINQTHIGNEIQCLYLPTITIYT